MAKQQLRADQGWIFDNFLMLSDNEDVLHPGIMGTRLHRGFMMEDLNAVYSKVTGRRSFPKSWAKRATALERLGIKAKSSNRNASAAKFFHRASLCYGRAQHLVPVHQDQNKETWYEGLGRCYNEVITLSKGELEANSVDFSGGKKSYFIFHKAKGDGPKPTILYLPGMDQVKEDFPNPFSNDYTKRGMNICAMDGPGQGECNINGVWQDKNNYALAAEKVIDWLTKRDDVDAAKIGVFGTSMGSRWGVQVAAHDPRVKAVVGQMANVGTFDIIFEQAQPNFKRIFMYMAGYSDENKFDDFVEGLDLLPDLAKQVKVPHLLVAGDMDELCTPKDLKIFTPPFVHRASFWH